AQLLALGFDVVEEGFDLGLLVGGEIELVEVVADALAEGFGSAAAGTAGGGACRARRRVAAGTLAGAVAELLARRLELLVHRVALRRRAAGWRKVRPTSGRAWR